MRGLLTWICRSVGVALSNITLWSCCFVNLKQCPLFNTIFKIPSRMSKRHKNAYELLRAPFPM